ncbi:MAG: YjjG family noncanonical pyrimidine nucleotidase [Christensenella sp.]|nr:MAG: YjjG family noncanonical pyrimidine nucleotidase [Christensenella sp.]
MVVFIDIDDTLLDFTKCANDAIKSACNKFGVPYTTTLVDTFHPINLDLWHRLEKKEVTKEKLFDTRFQIVFDKLGIKADGIAFETAFRENFHESAILVDGARDLLEYLRSKYKVYVASNASMHQQTNRMKKAELDGYIDGYFVSEEIGFPKPQKEFFDACFKALPDVKPQDVVMIGDSLSADIKGACEYGLKTIWYNHRNEPTSDVKCDYIVPRLSEVKNIL